MFGTYEMFCISSCNTLVADRGTCTVPLVDLYVKFGKHAMLYITWSNTPIADRVSCTMGPFLFCVYKLQNSMDYF